MFYNCITSEQQELKRLANLIIVEELTTNDLTMVEFSQYVKAFISHYHTYQAI